MQNNENEDSEEESSCQMHKTRSIIPTIALRKLKENALCYYAGFSAFKLIKILNCEICEKYLKDVTSSKTTNQKLIELKSYGNLTYATANFANFIELIASKFENSFPHYQFRENILAN